VSVKVKPISGREDTSGGIVFRFSDGKYYVVRANALEGNFRLYYYDRGRRQIATTSVTAPALGQWHALRVVAAGERMQAWLGGRLYLDHWDSRFRSGRVGLWTKADSVTAFDGLTIRGATGAGKPRRHHQRAGLVGEAAQVFRKRRAVIMHAWHGSLGHAGVRSPSGLLPVRREGD
jgi:hypothetical protein